MSTDITVTPIAGALGAEIGGVDLADLDDATVAAIRAVWLEHLVVFFRDQTLDSDEFLAFARRMAFVVAAPDVTIEPDALIAWARDEMANYKVPRLVEVVAELPVNATGKVVKDELRARAGLADRSAP